MADSSDFGKLLNTPCDKLLYARQKGRKISSNLMTICYVFCFGEPDYWRKRIMFTICFHHEHFFGKVFERKANKCCSILKSHCHSSKVHSVINLDMAKILKEKGFSDVLPCQKLCRQCVTKYEKLTKPPENNMTEIIETRIRKTN